jgi:hypothetical protein
MIGDSIRGNLFVSSVLALGFGLMFFLRHSRPPRKSPDSS